MFQSDQVTERSGLPAWERSTPRTWRPSGLWPASQPSPEWSASVCSSQASRWWMGRLSGQSASPQAGRGSLDSGGWSPVPTEEETDVLTLGTRHKEDQGESCWVQDQPFLWRFRMKKGKRQRNRLRKHLFGGNSEVVIYRNLPDL